MRGLCAASFGGQERAQVISQRRIEVDTRRSVHEHARRERVGAAAELRGGKAGLSVEENVIRVSKKRRRREEEFFLGKYVSM